MGIKNLIKKTINSNVSRRYLNDNQKFNDYMLSGWITNNKQSQQLIDFDLNVPTAFVKERQIKLSNRFLKDRIIIEAGSQKVRNNDCDYKFRAFSPFIYFTGLGKTYEPNAVLVFEPTRVLKSELLNLSIIKQKLTRDPYIYSHIVTLYIEEPKDRSTCEFYKSASHGEFWIGKRPSLNSFESATKIKVKPLSALQEDLSAKIKFGGKSRLLSESNSDAELFAFVDEMRLIKDSWEVSQVKEAVEYTKSGFEKIIAELPNIKNKVNGERIVDGLFYANAIEKANDVGYLTIAGSGENATTLHWTENNGTLKDGELLLIDAGVEVNSLYTADITRTFPISGDFSKEQREIYDIVLLAADTAFKEAKPGNKFIDIHNAAMTVIAQKLIEIGVLENLSIDEVLSNNGQQHRRWMFHGTSHHLGLDVHDCAKVENDKYKDGILKPGMILTIEPGLYFKSDDNLVPYRYRGIGIRIEDDILITENGAQNLSSVFPRNPEHLVSWMNSLQNK